MAPYGIDADTEQTDKYVSAETSQTETDDEVAVELPVERAPTGTWRSVPCFTEHRYNDGMRPSPTETP